MSEHSAPVLEPPVAEQLPPVPLTDEQLQKQFKIQVVEISDGVEANARDYAAEYINQQTTQGNFFKRTAKKIWYGNVARDFVQLKQKQIAREKIIEDADLYVMQRGSKDDHNRAAGAVVNRFLEESVHDEAGETQKFMADVENGAALQDSLKNLVKTFADAKNNLSEDALVAEKTRLLNEFGKSATQKDRNKGLLFADNIVEVALSAKAAFEHGVGLDRIDAALTAKHAEAKMGVRTEARLKNVERVANKLYQSKAGSLLNDTTINVVAATVVTAASFTTRKAAFAAGVLFTAGAGTAAVAAVRESLHIKQDRSTHAREMAEGGGSSIIHSGKRRESLEKTRYATVAAKDLIANLGATMAYQHSDADTLRSAVDVITQARVRSSMSDAGAIDLIQYSSKTRVEEERATLDRTIAEARARVQAAITHASPDLLTEAGITTRDATELFNQRSTSVTEQLTGDMSANDKAFRKLQAKRVAGMAAVAFISSETVGLGIQEAKAAVSDQLRGVFEGQHDDQTRRTLLAAIFRNSSKHGLATTSQVPGHELLAVNQNTSVNVPTGYHLTEHDGKWELFDAKNNVVDNNVTFNGSGQISEETRNLLTEKGFQFSETSSVINDGATVVNHQVTRTPAEYINAHPDKFTTVNRQLWYDNNTPGVYDHNEQALWWGGENGTGIDANGDYVLSMAHMTADGSWHAGAAANAQQLLHENKMVLALSATQNTQAHVNMIHFDAHGDAVISKDSFAAKSLFESQDGHAKFLGAYAEADQLGGVHDGVQSVNMLATVVGENHPHSFVDTVPLLTHHEHTQVTTELTAPTEAVSGGTSPVEIPWVLPIYGRGGLESEAGQVDNNYSDYGPRAYSAEALESYETHRSPRLEADPTAHLNTGEEINWQREEIRSKPGGEEYLRAIDEHVENSPELRELNNETKALVCIPVGATSEADNIYNTLSLYAQQPDEAKRQTKILLHVNWYDDAESNPEKSSKIQKTRAEIERARADFPDLSIADFTSVWDRETYGNDGIIYHVMNRLYDTALASINNAIEAGQMTSDAEVLMIRNDADSRGMAKDYLTREITAAEQNPTVDVFVSATRQGTDIHRQYPGFGVVSNMREVLDQVRVLLHKPLSTIGTNTAIRASALAAIGGIRIEGDGWTGCGSDDLALGRRIYAARVPGYAEQQALATGGQMYSQAAATDDTQSNLGLRSSATARYIPVAVPSLPAGSPQPIMYVRTAHIDASPDRLLNTYRTGRPITDSWSDFDAGGHVDRTEVGAGQRGLKGESTRVITGLARRVENNYTAMFNAWTDRDPDTIRLALGFALGEDESKYIVTWKSDGDCEFKFTDEGRQWLKSKLERDGRGRKDHFGDRVRRQLYHETQPRDRKKPASQSPRFVKAASRV